MVGITTITTKARDLACPYCDAPAGRSCAYPSGKRAPTHTARLKAARGEANHDGRGSQSVATGRRAQAQLKGGPLAYRVRSKSSCVTGGTDVQVVVVIGGETLVVDLWLKPGECTERGLRTAVESAVAGMRQAS